MLPLVLLLLIVPVFSSDFEAVIYTFDVQFYRMFNENECANNSASFSISYVPLSTLLLTKESTTVTLESKNRCMSSTTILFKTSSTSEPSFYLKTGSKCNDWIAVLNEEASTVDIIKENASGFSDNTMIIDCSDVGYVYLIGHDTRNEIVVIDSFRHILNPKNENEAITYSDSKLNPKRSIHASEVLNEDVPTDDAIGTVDEDSEAGITSDIRTDDNDTVIIQPVCVSLRPSTITMIALGIILVAILASMVAYKIGKARGRKDVDFSIEEESPPAFSIPRVKEVNDNNMRHFAYE